MTRNPQISGERLGKTEAGKYFVPPSEAEWVALSDLATGYATERMLLAPLTIDELRDHAAAIAQNASLPSRHHEFLMVLLNNVLWADLVASTPLSRRTLLLPPCLRSPECAAAFDELGLLCERCGRCDIGRLSDEAEAMGYAVIVAEGTSIVADLIRKDMIDAVIGVSCMPSLERTFPHILQHAVPALAIPLIKEGCADTAANVEWIRRSLRLSSSDKSPVVDLRALRETVQSWFSVSDLRNLLSAGDSVTERISLDWFAKAGKRWRPLLAISVYEALRPDPGEPLPDSVRSVALALECIHKASLIYDDVQDRDERRYGDRTVHEAEGVPMALTASLYLLGQGYRLIAGLGLDPATRGAMLELATKGHCDLCLGQGAELAWVRDPHPLTPDEVIDIFRWKTAPSFEVVLRLGALCTNSDPGIHAVLRDYSTASGIAYQIADDLEDFREGADVDDIKSARPSIVVASAYARAAGTDRQVIAEAWCGKARHRSSATVREVILGNGGEEAARSALEHWKQEALQALRPLRNRRLKLLLHRLIPLVFDRQK